MKKDTGYHVVLRFTEKAEPKLVGMYTKHRFDDQRAFERWRRRSKDLREVVAQGISEDEAYALCSENRRKIVQSTALRAGRQTTRAERLLDDPRVKALMARHSPPTSR